MAVEEASSQLSTILVSTRTPLCTLATTLTLQIHKCTHTQRHKYAHPHYLGIHLHSLIVCTLQQAVGCGWNRVEYQASAIKEAQGCLCRRSLKEDSGLLMMMTMLMTTAMMIKLELFGIGRNIFKNYTVCCLCPTNTECTLLKHEK